MCKSLVNRFNRLNPPETIILWLIISIFILPASWILGTKLFGLKIGISLSIFIGLIILLGRFYNMQAKSFITVLSVFLAAGTLFFQSRTLSIQTNALSIQNETLKTNLKQMQLSTRPQLVVNITPRIWNTDKESYFGGNVAFVNYGSFPARKVKSQFLLSNDTGRVDDFQKWFMDTYGGFPQITFVPAKSSSGELPLTPSIPRAANFACIGALVTYQGHDSNKSFWYVERKTYRLKKNTSGESVGLVLVNSLQESDDDSSAGAPSLELPSWSDFKIGEVPK